MIRRLFWAGLGIGLGGYAAIYVSKKIDRAAESLAPSSLAGSVVGVLATWNEQAKAFVADVRVGMVEREAELRSAVDVPEP